MLPLSAVGNVPAPAAAVFEVADVAAVSGETVVSAAVAVVIVFLQLLMYLLLLFFLL